MSRQDAMDVLKETSRTFYIPIARLPLTLRKAVASAYLCMRAIDEVEDHPSLSNGEKVMVLKAMSAHLQAGVPGTSFSSLTDFLETFGSRLPEVSVRMAEWALYAPPDIAPRIWDATAAMSDRMAYWAGCNWLIDTAEDLDRYTFGVAGAVGLLLSDLWAWFDGTQSDRLLAIGFGRGLQAVNILRNHHEDRDRGVSFFPKSWGQTELHTYAQFNLSLADRYTQALPQGPALDFCQIPLTLAHATLEIMQTGAPKLSRSEVMALVAQVTGA